MRITAHYSRSIYSVISLAANSYKIFITKDGAGINAFCLQNTNTRPRSSARRLYPLHSLPLFRVGGRSWGTFSNTFVLSVCVLLTRSYSACTTKSVQLRCYLANSLGLLTHSLARIIPHNQPLCVLFLACLLCPQSARSVTYAVIHQMTLTRTITMRST
jgi:hypothetical protein